jgi:tetratricopeptide (TPR) repeat protein
MKSVITFLFAAAMTTVAFGQNEKYVAAMEAKVPLVDSNYSPEGWKDLANSFERIGDAEKTQWLPYYYASYCTIMGGYGSLPKEGGFGDNSATIDPLADKAETLLNKAEALSKDNAEIFVVRKMVHGLRMMGNAMARFMSESPLAEEALNKAISINPNIPRIYILQAEDKFHTPEQYGGSKDEAKVLFEKAQSLFSTFKPESSISPNWGRGTVRYYLSQYK